MNTVAKIGALALTIVMMIFTVGKAQGCNKQDNIDVLPATKSGPMPTPVEVEKDPAAQTTPATEEKDAGAHDASAELKPQELKILPATKSGILPATKSAKINMLPEKKQQQNAQPQPANPPK